MLPLNFIRSLPSTPALGMTSRGASRGALPGCRVWKKGTDRGIRHAPSFGRLQPVTQQVIPSYFFMEAPVKQTELALLGRLDAPSVVAPELVGRCRSYRDAVKLCWQLRRVRNMTQKSLAEEAGLYPPHVSGYLMDKAKACARDLPGSKVVEFQTVCGNTAISQWLSQHSRLTVLEEMQLVRRSA